MPLTFLAGRHPRRTLARAAARVGLSVVIFGWVLLPLRAQGISMQPTFEPGGYHLVNRLALLFRQPARGDIVAIRLAGPGVMNVKRIVGLPGERVRIAGGVVYVNDRAWARGSGRHGA